MKKCVIIAMIAIAINGVSQSIKNNELDSVLSSLIN